MYRGFSLNIYNILLMILASLISGLGLLYNNTPAILGSMLISPLGSPIVANIIYLLTNSYKKSLYNLINFIIIVQICMFIGILIGFINRNFSILKTPTPEMLSRITYTHVIIDAALAGLSGICLGLSLINSDLLIKTGVSLILSFTPPLVNFGIFYGEALYYYFQKIFDKPGEKKLNQISKKISKLTDDGNKSLILFFLNLITMYITLVITLFIVCK